ncbi:hypothetical protein G5B40_00440 [Pikeienuella piscinae]|uniref:Uncharacterized protein n=1 Tax=Pikeienuella piscinae TaxID=2748098 RepID=A0A7L5BSE6_9RHOB|nr:hypothetical protein [Pikeienuella piscinae]QIE54040.1 hypothetical protein G5B40_00440 [Pikeienuella piscinae]
MKIQAIIAAFLLMLAPISGAAQSSGTPEGGGALRVEYPTKGNQDILIAVDASGAVTKVFGGASEVTSFSLSERSLSFSTKATTDWGMKSMKFGLDAKDGGFDGHYNITRGCSNNCYREASASWE